VVETFVIQIPTAAERAAETSPDELRGVAEHVGTGRRQPFADTRELLAFLCADYRDLPKEVER
jgi:hypothetical protein